MGMEFSVAVGWGDAGYNDYYWDMDNGKLNDLKLSLSLPVRLSKWTVTPGLHYVTLLDNRLREKNSGVQKNDMFFAGIGLGREF
ncbi:MAG: hypothetical protein ABR497_12970 [Kiritimatiellia bacterium]